MRFSTYNPLFGPNGRLYTVLSPKTPSYLVFFEVDSYSKSYQNPKSTEKNRDRIYLFFGTDKKMVHSIDAEKSYLSIGDGFRAIRAPSRERNALECKKPWIWQVVSLFRASLHMQSVRSHGALP